MPKPAVNPNTIHSGSADTTRYPGFHSPEGDGGMAAPATPELPTVSLEAANPVVQPSPVKKKTTSLSGIVRTPNGIIRGVSPVQTDSSLSELRQPAVNRTSLFRYSAAFPTY